MPGSAAGPTELVPVCAELAFEIDVIAPPIPLQHREIFFLN